VLSSTEPSADTVGEILDTGHAIVAERAGL
jgi:hypothetical protein